MANYAAGRGQQIGVITKGSLVEGLEMKLDPEQNVEDMKAGKFVVIEGDKNDDESYDYSMMAAEKAREFRDMLPASMRERYEVVPIVTEPCEGALSHFDTITTVIDRRAEAGAPDAL